MQLIGEVVFHKKFGEGKILDKLDGIIIIHFPAGEKKFYFPDAFEKHLVLKSKRKQRQVDELVDDLVSEREACENARMEEQKRQERIKSLKVTPNSQAAFGFVHNSKRLIVNFQLSYYLPKTMLCGSHRCNETACFRSEKEQHNPRADLGTFQAVLIWAGA